MSTPKRIIVADDDSKIRKLLLHALRPPEFEVYTFASGTAALEALRDIRPDCVVSDMLMPDMDGERLLRAVRGVPGQERVPFLVVSAFRSEARIQRVLEAGAAAFMLKPLPVRELAEKIRAVTNQEARARAIGQAPARLPLRAPASPAPAALPSAPATAAGGASPAGGTDDSSLPVLEVDLLDAPPAPPRSRRTELRPSHTVLGFGRFTKVEQSRHSYVVLTEIELAPQFTITTTISERGIGRRRLQSSLLHPMTREEDRELIRRQVDQQHEDAIERLPDLILEGGSRQVVWSDQSRSADPELLAWAVSALAQRAEAEAGMAETVRILRRTLERATLANEDLRALGVTDLGRVIVEPGHGRRLPRRAVDAVAHWCVAFAAEALEARERDVVEPIRQATRQRGRELERLGFYARLRRAAS